MSDNDRYKYTHCKHCMGELDRYMEKIYQTPPIILYIMICYQCQIKYWHYFNRETQFKAVYETKN